MLLAAILFFGVLLALVFLHIHLSKKEKKWLGLIVPGFNVFGALIAAIVLIFYSAAQTTYLTVVDGMLVEQVSQVGMGAIILSAVVAFFVLNISTGVLLLIYRYIKKQMKIRKYYEDMSVLGD